MKNQSLLAASLALALLAPAAARADAVSEASPQPISLDGTTSYDEWTVAGLTNPPNSGFPGFPGSNPWPNPIGSNLGEDATLDKTANGSGGGPYPASGSIYFGGFSAATNNHGGELTLTDSTIAFDLNTVVLQVEIGEAWGYDFWNHELPTLSYTTSSGTVSDVTATFSRKIVQAYNGTVEMPTGEEAVYINLWGLQWDLSEVSEPITSYSISFIGVQHAQLYALRLDSSDAIHSASVLPVPEPSTWLLVGLGLGALLWTRRRGLSRAAARG